MEPQLIKMWGITDWSMRCGGCYSDNCYCKDEPCNAKACAPQKGLSECRECTEFPCVKATSADMGKDEENFELTELTRSHIQLL